MINTKSYACHAVGRVLTLSQSLTSVYRTVYNEDPSLRKKIARQRILYVFSLYAGYFTYTSLGHLGG